MAGRAAFQVKRALGALTIVATAALLMIWLKGGPGWRTREQGELQFRDACAPCHDRSGKGVTGKGRPLVDSPWVKGPSSRFIRIILDGVAHVEGSGPAPLVPMPSWRIVDDQYIADVATYARKHFGGGAPPIEAAEVRDIRKATADRGHQWTRDELNRIP